MSSLELNSGDAEIPKLLLSTLLGVADGTLLLKLLSVRLLSFSVGFRGASGVAPLLGESSTSAAAELFAGGGGGAREAALEVRELEHVLAGRLWVALRRPSGSSI